MGPSCGEARTWGGSWAGEVEEGTKGESNNEIEGQGRFLEILSSRTIQSMVGKTSPWGILRVILHFYKRVASCEQITRKEMLRSVFPQRRQSGGRQDSIYGQEGSLQQNCYQSLYIKKKKKLQLDKLRK